MVNAAALTHACSFWDQIPHRRTAHSTPPACSVDGVLRMQMLVFSAWPEVLELLAHSLDGHGVPYLAGKDKASLQRALDAFDGSRETAAHAVEQHGGATIHRPRGLAGRRKRPRGSGGAAAEPRVLLLLLKQAAAGLNLVQAQHVLLIEPSTNPSVEAQVCVCLAAPAMRRGRLWRLLWCWGVQWPELVPCIYHPGCPCGGACEPEQGRGLRSSWGALWPLRLMQV